MPMGTYQPTPEELRQWETEIKPQIEERVAGGAMTRPQLETAAAGGSAIAQAALKAGTPTAPVGPEAGIMDVPPPSDQWPEGYYPVYDPAANFGLGGYVWSVSPDYIYGPTPEEELPAGIYPSLADIPAELLEGNDVNWSNQYGGYFLLPKGISDTEMSEWEKEQIDIQQEQLHLTEQAQAWQQTYQQQQLDVQQQQYLSQLAAQPRSWLQYAGATGETPAVQPWMLPLMPQQYAGLGAGEAIPGYGAESMTGMPELTRPSRQYQARLSPSQLQQYEGYRQARTGERPEDIQWRLWQGAPPGGGYQGLRRAR